MFNSNVQVKNRDISANLSVMEISSFQSRNVLNMRGTHVITSLTEELLYFEAELM